MQRKSRITSKRFPSGNPTKSGSNACSSSTISRARWIFVNLVAEISEEQEHHPDIDIRYNKVKLSIYTHNKNGLTELDFQLAERIDTLSEE